MSAFDPKRTTGGPRPTPPECSRKLLPLLVRASGVTMRRRDFIKVIACSFAAWPIMSRAQQLAVPVIGYLSGRSPEEDTVSAFLKGLNEAGYIDGRNVSIEY